MSRTENSGGRAPLHLWAVGIIGLLWNAMGAFDFLMTQTHNASYMSQFAPEQLEYFYGFPTWVVVTWGVASLGGVVGAVLLLTRRRLATLVFAISLIALIATTIHNYVLSDGLELAGGTFSIIFTGVILLVAIGLLIYAGAMQRRRILR